MATNDQLLEELRKITDHLERIRELSEKMDALTSNTFVGKFLNKGNKKNAIKLS
jgi:hypothetical protein